MKYLCIAIGVIALIVVSGCVVPEENKGKVSDKDIVGNDKDEHGCIGSAGYTWCETKQKCIRTWEENCTA